MDVVKPGINFYGELSYTFKINQGLKPMVVREIMGSNDHENYGGIQHLNNIVHPERKWGQYC
jgi:hypothetical protein